MARIGNQTVWSKYKILFLERNTNPQTGQSDYVREIVNATNKKVIANDTITTNAQLNANSILGYMMTVTTSNTQTTPSPYLTQAFASTNKFVFLFKVNYIKSTLLTMHRFASTIEYGQKVPLSGNMTDLSGKPLPISPVQLYLESSVDSGQTWQQITLVTTSPNGAYNYSWAPNPGNYLVRAHYLGTTNAYAETYSTPLPLLVTKSNTTLTVSASPASFAIGQNVTIAVTMAPLVAGANITVSYTTDNKTFTPIRTIAMGSQTMSFTWKADVSGRFMIVATWQGNQDYSPVAASVTVHTG
jgi:hypothetical protein